MDLLTIVQKSNRAYAMTESRVPSVKGPLPSHYTPPGKDLFQNDNHGCHTQKTPRLDHFKSINFNSGHEHAIHRFTKADIRHAEIINQVDRKFIACRISIPKHTDAVTKSNLPDREAQPNSVLVLIDQHAADERIRVEFFLKELFMGFLHSEDHMHTNQTGGVRVKELNPPRPVLLTQQEALTIKRSQNACKILRQWGVRITESSTDLDNASESGSSTGYSQLFVSSIPEVVSDKVCILRCFRARPIAADFSCSNGQLLQGDELRDFIKGFIGQIQSGELLFSASHLDLPPEADEDELFWFKAVRRCPRGLLDLINSKACRGMSRINF